MTRADTSTWRKLIAEAQADEREWKEDKRIADDGPIIACTLTEAELDVEFEDGYGTNEGKPFTAWSEKYVYFPVVYDGAEWVGRAPRNPCGEATSHQGGG